LKTKNFKHTLLTFAFASWSICSLAQTSITKDNLKDERNVITTAVPFLNITPDARSGGLGDAGVAMDPDANSIHWNVGKLAFIPNDKKAGISLSATPWLKQLVPDMWLYYLSGYSKFGKDNRSVLAASMRYFTLGEIQFTDDQGNPMGTDKPQEFAFDVAYSSKLSERFSVGVALRFVQSRLVSRVYSSDVKAGLAGAGDIGVYWKDDIKISGKDVTYALGANISNMGSKITYTTDANRDFIPINMRLGTYWKIKMDEYNQLGLMLDFNKLMVPTPQYEYDTVNGQQIITGRKLDNSPVIAGMFSSFGDAPGGFGEELKEFTTSAGMEYWYDEQFALRAGYFHEAKTKGGRNYLTFGIGIRYNVFGLDIAYLQPISQRHPLQNTLRFTLLFDIQAFKSQSKDPVVPSK
jgi:hypothetical protein